MDKLRNFKHVYLIGGSTDIGVKLSNKLILDNCRISNFDIKKPNIFSDKYSFIKCDLSNPKEASDLFSAHIISQNLNLQQPTCLIFLARSRELDKKNNLEEYQRIMKICLDSAVFISNKFVEITSKCSSIIYLSSLSSKFVSDESLSYQISKSGLNTLSSYIAVNNNKNIRTCSILLGLIVQDRNIKRYESKDNHIYREKCEKYQPNNIVGTTNDVVNCILSIMYYMPDYFNGQEIILDGAASKVDHFKLASKFI